MSAEIRSKKTFCLLKKMQATFDFGSKVCIVFGTKTRHIYKFLLYEMLVFDLKDLRTLFLLHFSCVHLITFKLFENFTENLKVFVQ